VTRDLTIEGVQWRVHVVPAAPGHQASLRYASEFGYGCSVPLSKTTLDGTEESFAGVSEELLAGWARQAMQPRPRRRF
jgi:hypothetical protein